MDGSVGGIQREKSGRDIQYGPESRVTNNIKDKAIANEENKI